MMYCSRHVLVLLLYNVMFLYCLVNCQVARSNLVHFGNLLPESYHRLVNSSAKLRSFRAEKNNVCAKECTFDKLCKSYNIEAKEDYAGAGLECELMSIDKYIYPNALKPDSNFHHFAFTSLCSKFPCTNGAQCIPTYELNDYRCDCHSGWTGKNCETDLDECASGTNNCHADAECGNTAGSYTCSCKTDFFGDGISCTACTTPMAIFPLDQAYGTKDFTGNNSEGTAYGTSLTTGPTGLANKAYHFAGSTTSYIEFANNGNLDTRYSITILAWTYAELPGPIWNYMTNAFGVHIYITGIPVNSILARHVSRSLGSTSAITYATNVLNTWVHIGTSYNYSTGNCSLWVNGVKVKELSIGVLELATQYPVRVGYRDGENRAFKGKIACLQLYNKELSQDEVQFRKASATE